MLPLQGKVIWQYNVYSFFVSEWQNNGTEACDHDSSHEHTDKRSLKNLHKVISN